MTGAALATVSNVVSGAMLLGLCLLILLSGSGVARWNRRRLDRARRYRARHGTPWWVLETEQAWRQRQWLDRERARTDDLSNLDRMDGLR